MGLGINNYEYVQVSNNNMHFSIQLNIFMIFKVIKQYHVLRFRSCLLEIYIVSEYNEILSIRFLRNNITFKR